MGKNNNTKKEQILYVCIGLPSSGKSTWTKKKVAEEKGHTVVVSKDDIRKTLFKEKTWHRSNENLVIEVERSMVRTALSNGKSVIVDDTNLNPKYPNYWNTLSDEFNIDVKIVDFRNVPVQQCVDFDKVRPNSVGSDVIWNMAFMFGLAKQEKEFVISDIDGTLTDLSERKQKSVRADGTIDWAIFFNPDLIKLDKPREETFKQIKNDIDNGYEIILCSGRSDSIRKETVEWLQYYGERYLKNPQWYSRLIMRQRDDHRPDEQLKEYFAKKYMDVSKCVKVYDDRPKVIRVWQNLGLNVIDVGDGKEF